jgi:pimeloyl-ACP methyl ester carboxylesterase
MTAQKPPPTCPTVERCHFDIHLPESGMRLEAAWIGPPPETAPTLVLLHEGLGSVTLWRDFPERLVEATGCGALLYSRQGYGRSDPCSLPRPIDFMHHEALAVLPEVVRQTGIRDHILIGHSDGGSIALIRAGSRPNPGLLGAVTLAAHVFCEGISRRAIAVTGDKYRNGDLKFRLTTYHGDNTDCAFWGWHDVWLSPEFIHWNIEEFLPAITKPLLVIQGEDDPYGTAAQVEVIGRQAGGQVETAMFAACGHAPHLEQKAAVVGKIAGFIAGLTADKSLSNSKSHEKRLDRHGGYAASR